MEIDNKDKDFRLIKEIILIIIEETKDIEIMQEVLIKVNHHKIDNEYKIIVYNFGGDFGQSFSIYSVVPIFSPPV